MLKGFEIYRYRSLAKVKADDLTRLTLLAGRNNSGKTSILRALDQALRFLQTHRSVGELKYDGQEAEPHTFAVRLKVTFSIDNRYPPAIADIAPNSLQFSLVHLSDDVWFIQNVKAGTQTIFTQTEREAIEIHLRSVELDKVSDALRVIAHFGPIDSLNKLHIAAEQLQKLELGERIQQSAQNAINMQQPGLLGSAIASTTQDLQNTRARLISEQSEARSRSIDASLMSIEQLEKVINLAFSWRHVFISERRSYLGPEDAHELAKLKMHRGSREKWNRLNSESKSLLGENIDVFGDNTLANIEIGTLPEFVNGSGAREVASLLYHLELGSADLVLLEEPEIHSHPGLVASLSYYLQSLSKARQLLISTHSPVLLRSTFLSGADSSIYQVTQTGGKTRLKKVEVDEDLFEVSAELGITPAALFMFERLLLVEGPSDESIIRDFAFKLGIDLSKANIGIVPMGGVTMFANYTSGKLLDYLHQHHVPLTFLLDRDENEDADVRTLRERIGNRAELHVLERRELENYLLSTGPIRRWIASTLDEQVDEAAIQRALNEVSDEVREEAIRLRLIRKLGKPVYFDREDRESFSEVLQRGIAKVQQRLTDLPIVEASIRAEVEQSNPLIDFPGSLLLEKALGRFNKGFSKARGDSAKLATHFEIGDIPDEIKRILERLVR